MTPLHVLVYAPLDAGACNVYRFGILARALAEHGVELRGFTKHRVAVPERDAGSPDRMYASDDLVLDRAELDWADVVVFRRFYATTWSCLNCAFVSSQPKAAKAHGRLTRHEIAEPDRLVRPLYNALESYPELLRGRALVYETDDDLLNIQPWNGIRNRMLPEQDMVERMLRRADLVTVSTPVLQTRLQRYNDEIRVLRNAVDPSWYEAPLEGSPPIGSPRILYYGMPVRFRDYEVCQAAVDTVVASTPGARRVWLGALNSRSGGSPSRVLAAMDEVGPYIEDPRAFATALASARPHIGLAPLVGDFFDQAKSELHWLEYTMAGAATVATRIPGGGPYEPIRDGIDGLLASTPGEWLSALQRLSESASLRDEMAGRARERVLAEYTVDVRASEWAAAYRWAAEHPGRRIGGRVHGLGSLGDHEIERQGRASLAARLASREELESAPIRLARARGSRVSCGPATGDEAARVSVVMPVVDEAASAVARALRSVLDGTYQDLEVLLVAADTWPSSLAEVVADVAPFDQRVRALVRDVGIDIPNDPAAARIARVGRLLVAGVSEVQGSWIAPISPETEFTPDHVAVLLGIAQEHDLEFVYGRAEVVLGDARVRLGAWPPNPDGVLTIATELFAAPLVHVVPLRPDAWREADTTGWAFWRSAFEVGVRMAGIDYLVSTMTPLSGSTGSEAAGDGAGEAIAGTRTASQSPTTHPVRDPAPVGANPASTAGRPGNRSRRRR